MISANKNSYETLTVPRAISIFEAKQFEFMQSNVNIVYCILHNVIFIRKDRFNINILQKMQCITF